MWLSSHRPTPCSFSGSSYAYSKKNVSKTHDNPNSPIAGKTIVFLGSSVTYGFAGFGTSFVDYLAAIDHAVCIKEAVSGTTLTDLGLKSYIKRLQAKLHSVSKVDYLHYIRTQVFHVQDDGFCHAVDGQVAFQLVFIVAVAFGHLLADKGDRRELLDIEKVR